MTLLEVVIAVAVSLLITGAAFASALQAIALVKNAREHAAAAHALQERVEQLRSTNWINVVNPTWLASNDFMGRVAANAAVLPPIRERIEIREWPVAPGATPSITVTRENGEVVTNSSSQPLTSRAVQIELSLTWQSGARELTYATSTVISKGGVTR